jgi:hypothetical protein
MCIYELVRKIFIQQNSNIYCHYNFTVNQNDEVLWLVNTGVTSFFTSMLQWRQAQIPLSFERFQNIII